MLLEELFTMFFIILNPMKQLYAIPFYFYFAMWFGFLCVAIPKNNVKEMGLLNYASLINR